MPVLSNFTSALLASIVLSLISLLGVVIFFIKNTAREKVLFFLVAFSAGSLIAAAFLHLIPEALGHAHSERVFHYIIAGFIFFFILEKHLYWRHCHSGSCDVHAFTYLNLIGDAIHNFSDGLIIGASFLVSIRFGVVTSLVILFHEIPQELGDFAVLIYGGLSKLKALTYNFISALTCVLGTVLGFYLSHRTENFFVFVLPFTAGGFIYIAACDLIPELHKQPDKNRSNLSLLYFFIGILFILLTGFFHNH